MEGKTEEEVERYAKVFKERYKELNGKCCHFFFYFHLSRAISFWMKLGCFFPAGFITLNRIGECEDPT